MMLCIKVDFFFFCSVDLLKTAAVLLELYFPSAKPRFAANCLLCDGLCVCVCVCLLSREMGCAFGVTI